MNIEELKEQLKRHEGFRNKTYRCTGGALTIGYGRNLDARGISRAEAEIMLDNDILSSIDELNKHLPDILPNLSENRQNVMVNMCYNLGIGGLMAFKRTLALIREGNYQQASIEMLNSKWASQVGSRARELSEQMRIG